MGAISPAKVIGKHLVAFRAIFVDEGARSTAKRWVESDDSNISVIKLGLVWS